MVRLPVIVGFGGFNAAGRSSFHQAYQRTVLDSLDTGKRQQTLAGLATMMGLVRAKGGRYYDANDASALSPAQIEQRFAEHIRNNTHIRRIDPGYFDVDKVPMQHKLKLADTEQQTLCFSLSRRQLPAQLPDNWQIVSEDSQQLQIQVHGHAEIGLASHRESPVQCAGQLPRGFDPAALYNARFHPRGLQLAVTGASDAINALGVDWQTIVDRVAPDEIGAYSTSVMSQLDHCGYGGLLQARLQGERVTTKQLALGLNSMSADFVNAYVLGNIGATGSIAGACASFLYNLRAGVEDIQSGRRRVVVVGSSEAPILPEVVEGYGAMGALATVDKLAALQGRDRPDLRTASRPFGDNCGFVIAESTQHVVLMDDALAIELGAQIHGAVSHVFTHADGVKKSISAPGAGNYITLAKAVASACTLLGDDVVARRSFVQAHGSSTPQNRVTESLILSRVAAAFGIEQWPVTAVKAFVGHSLAPASGDQLINSLGVFAQGILPGITTVDQVADDVLQRGLDFVLQHRHLDQSQASMAVAFLNSKGFGGNNATAAVLSPAVVNTMLAKRYGAAALSAYQAKVEQTIAQADVYHQDFLQGNYRAIYRFGEKMIDDKDVVINRRHISLASYKKPIALQEENLYKDMK
ncbi:MAG: beta-ketoacyl synthase [Cellvibrionaceae bacterium]|nr:beta-ketoacyl synthase [Cellvibrionaceae bacterium]